MRATKAAMLFSSGLAAILPIASPALAGAPVTLSVATTPTANASTNVQPTVSIDSLWLARPTVFTSSSSTVAQFLRTLAGDYPVKRLRVGAHGADVTYWSRQSEATDPTPSWATRGRITPTGISALDQLSQTSGYSIVLHTNLEQYRSWNTSILNSTKDMVIEARNKMGTRLSAVVIGNEPDHYSSTNQTTFQSDWKTYRDSIRASIPGLALYGPATLSRGTLYNSFRQNQASDGVSIGALTSHHYYGTNCGGDTLTIGGLFNSSRYDEARGYASGLAADARALGVPAVIDERNSSSCAGTPGVSDVFASSLWGLDSTLLIARSGVSRQYLHSSFGRCGDIKPYYTYYTPFCARTDADAAVGKVVAQPLFYGLLAARFVGDGTFYSTGASSADQARLRTYAIKQGSTLTLVLINLESSSTSVTAQLGGTYGSASRAQLTAPSISATSGITLGGGTVRDDGTFSGIGFSALALTDPQTLNVTVPGYSASIVRLN